MSKMNFSPQKIGFLSLGCPRNLVDTEVMLGLIKNAGYIVEEDINQADVAVVNTCGFIKDAKEESIEAILKIADLKKEGSLKGIVVTGCLSQRYKDELRKELPEVDIFLGTGNFKEIVSVLKNLPTNGNENSGKVRLTQISTDEKHKISTDIIEVGKPNFIYDHKNPRFFLTPSHYAYVKISEGCKNNCSYCVIKELRGDFRSRPLPSILRELKTLSENKPLKEIVLIGQDTTLYGVDLYKEPKICELLREVCSLDIVEWVRLLYTHPAHINKDFIDVVKNKPSICRYIDLPVQHISDKILKRMNRGISKKGIIGLIEKLRREIPDIAIRTSLIVGFPGETESDFKELLDFVCQTEFERLGVFIYSREEGTPAFNFKNQVPEKLKKERFDLIMKTQQEIAKRKNRKFLGRVLDVLIDEKDEKDPGLFIGRTEFDAPEVDGVVYIKSEVRGQKSEVRIGEFAKVKIIDTLEYDLVGMPIQ